MSSATHGASQHTDESLLVRLNNGIAECFNLAELESMAFDLGLQFENIKGQTLGEKSRELVLWMNRRGLIQELLAYCTMARPRFPWRLSKHKKSSSALSIPISVRHTDVFDFSCDVLVLKFPQELIGLELKVAKYSHSSAFSNLRLLPSQFKLILMESTSFKNTLLIGVPPLWDFDYAQIREFSRYSIDIVTKHLPSACQIATTVHGVSYGLDEEEAFRSQIAGIIDSIQDTHALNSKLQITILEWNIERAQRLQKFLAEMLVEERNETLRLVGDQQRALNQSGLGYLVKPYIVVSLPNTHFMNRVFESTLKPCIQAHGVLCERLSYEIGNAAKLKWLRTRIESAMFFITTINWDDSLSLFGLGCATGAKKKIVILTEDDAEQLADSTVIELSIGNMTKISENLGDIIRSLYPT